MSQSLKPNPNKIVIILGSSNSKGNTYKIISRIEEIIECKIVDLNDKNISDFDYQNKNSKDDFIPLIEDILSGYDIMVLATPVYWYTMSAQMKRFLDRYSDLLKFRKDLGRQLRGKKMAVLSCGHDTKLKKGFHMPFKASAKYLGMEYIGDVHTWLHGEKIDAIIEYRIKEFTTKITKLI